MIQITVDYAGFKGVSPETAVKWLSNSLRAAKRVQKAAKKFQAAIAQPAVHHLGKAEVVGSNPTRSSKKKKKKSKKWISMKDKQPQDAGIGMSGIQMGN